MIRFTSRDVVPVKPPYQLELVVDALRRLAANIVDVVDDDGAYYRALPHGDGYAVVRVVQLADDGIEVRTTAKDPAQLVAQVATMLGAHANVAEWYERVAAIPWLHELSSACLGLRPPRYPTLFEACSHAIVFQQISIHAAASIMRRFVQAFGQECEVSTAFPKASVVLDAPDRAFEGIGLSRSKIAHLRSVAHAIESGEISQREIEALPTPAAAERLISVRGIGPWSAAVVLLRGFGRLDTFPMRDSGVARTIKLLSGDPNIDLDALLAQLGPVRGLLYYHLLLGRVRNLVPAPKD